MGVGAEVGVPAALPHDGDPIVTPGEEVVNPSNTFLNFFILTFFLCDYEMKKNSASFVMSQWIQDHNLFR